MYIHLCGSSFLDINKGITVNELPKNAQVLNLSWRIVRGIIDARYYFVVRNGIVSKFVD